MNDTDNSYNANKSFLLESPFKYIFGRCYRHYYVFVSQIFHYAYLIDGTSQ